VNLSNDKDSNTTLKRTYLHCAVLVSSQRKWVFLVEQMFDDNFADNWKIIMVQCEGECTKLFGGKMFKKFQQIANLPFFPVI
jgi:hypothetical protein